MNLTVRPEASKDRESVWNVNCTAFESDTEARLVDALRDGAFAEISLVADIEGSIVGHILFSLIAIHTDGGTVQALSLAPMAVLPEYQRQGVGSRLVQAGLEACREQGHRIATVLGHPAFYPRFGFSAERATPLENPFGGGQAWMALELVSGALVDVAGKVEYPPPFMAFE